MSHSLSLILSHLIISLPHLIILIHSFLFTFFEHLHSHHLLVDIYFSFTDIFFPHLSLPQVVPLNIFLAIPFLCFFFLCFFLCFFFLLLILLIPSFTFVNFFSSQSTGHLHPGCIHSFLLLPHFILLLFSLPRSLSPSFSPSFEKNFQLNSGFGKTNCFPGFAPLFHQLHLLKLCSSNSSKDRVSERERASFS